MNKYGTVTSLLRLFFALCCVGMLLGCTKWSQRGAKGVGTLAKPTANETRFSPYQPAHPYQQLAKGLLGRKVFQGTAGTMGSVEVDDLLVGPRQQSDTYTFKSPALFEVKSGAGTLQSGEQPQKIEPGTVVPMPGGRTFTIQNEGDLPIAIRVQVLGPS
ncbi:MAG: hypothetical protein ACJ72H_29355 [Candidatus Sulfotelmatobacter sp.]|jgi:mannose-6-phosphate isomerase-like protein (cupin superfamily)